MVWSSSSEKHLKKELQLVQNREARLVLCYPFQANVSDMHRKLSWLLVKVKLHLPLLVYFHKVFKYHTPCSLFENIMYMWDSDMIIKHQVSKAHLFFFFTMSTNKSDEKDCLSRLCCLEYGSHKYTKE